MWNRQQVKEQAKQIMKRNYWKMFLVTLIAGILSTNYVTFIQEVQGLVPDVVLPSMFSSILSFLSIEYIVGLLFLSLLALPLESENHIISLKIIMEIQR